MPKKETSSKISSEAAKQLNKKSSTPAQKSVAASAVSQDEHKGNKGEKGKSKKK